MTLREKNELFAKVALESMGLDTSEETSVTLPIAPRPGSSSAQVRGKQNYFTSDKSHNYVTFVLY